MRSKKAIKNLLLNWLSVAVSIIIGLVVPRFILITYGSEINGIISSVTQFLNYISLLESGIGGVIVACLYKPLAEKNDDLVNAILSKCRKFFLKISAFYLIYLIAIAFVYPYIAKSNLDYKYIVILVLVIGISLFIQYCFTITYSILLQALQQYYVVSSVTTILQLINAVVMIILINKSVDILIVKFVSSLIFILSPIVLYVYVKRNFNLSKNYTSHFEIPQKKDSILHHLSYFILNNTDIVVITLFMGVAQVSVYIVYYMVVSSIGRFMEGFVVGTQGAFGDMLAKQENKLLKQRFAQYEYLIIILTTIIFTITAIMILPFVKLYTAGVKDTNYYAPIFAMLLVGAQAFYIFRLPYHTMIKAAAHFKQTKMSALYEAILNIVISVVLVYKFGIVGVAFGTLIAMGYRTIYYINYLSKNIVYIDKSRSFTKIGVNFIIAIFLIFALINFVSNAKYSVVNWIGYAIIVLGIVVLVTGLLNLMIFKKDVLMIFGNIKRKKIG